MSIDHTIRDKVRATVSDPKTALDHGWHEDPDFCATLFDRCENMALTLAPGAFELAEWAMEIGGANGQCHVYHRGVGVLSHAYLSRGKYFMAGKVLELSRREALACCTRCKYPFLLRQGDLRAEERRTDAALSCLKGAVEEGSGLLDEDALARILFPRSVAYHFDGQRRRALEDAGEVLRRLSLDSPRGFFLDTLALIGVYIGGGGPEDDAYALDLVREFRRRLVGRRDVWRDVHTRALWLEGHLQARLGDLTRAARCLKKAQVRLLADGLEREVVAVSLDGAQLKCRPGCLRSDLLDTASEILGTCLERRRDLTEDHRSELERMRYVLMRSPEAAFREMVAFRRSFVAPVPGQLGERIGPE